MRPHELNRLHGIHRNARKQPKERKACANGNGITRKNREFEERYVCSIRCCERNVLRLHSNKYHFSFAFISAHTCSPSSAVQSNKFSLELFKCNAVYMGRWSHE